MKKTLIIICSIVLVLAVIVGGGILYLINTPEYALAKLCDEVKDTGFDAVLPKLTDDAREKVDPILKIINNNIVQSILSFISDDDYSRILVEKASEIEWSVGGISIEAYSDFFQLMLRAALVIPDFIPLVGGLEIAAAELGGSTQKLWGKVSILEIGFGVTYYWTSGDLQFGSISATEGTADITPLSTDIPVAKDEKTGQILYMSIGTNSRRGADSSSMDAILPFSADNEASIIASQNLDNHIINITKRADMILALESLDGGAELVMNDEELVSWYSDDPNVVVTDDGHLRLVRKGSTYISGSLRAAEAAGHSDIALVSVETASEVQPEVTVSDRTVVCSGGDQPVLVICALYDGAGKMTWQQMATLAPEAQAVINVPADKSGKLKVFLVDSKLYSPLLPAKEETIR